MRKQLLNIWVLPLVFLVFYLGAGVSVVHVCSQWCEAEVCHRPESEEPCCCLSDVTYECQQLHDRCTCVNFTCHIDYYFSQLQTDACLPVLYPACLPHWSPSLSVGLPVRPSADIACTGPPPLSGRKVLALFDTLLI